MTQITTPPELKTLISAADLQQRITEIAAEIDRDYADCENLLCVGVLKGSVFFLVDLLKQVNIPVSIDFFQTSSYRGTKTPGEIRIRQDIEVGIRGRDVLLIEDIVDTGYTLRTILDLLRFRGANSVKLCALLDKVATREVDVPIDYAGFPIDDIFVVGYGLDYQERYRNLPFIACIDGPVEAENAGKDEEKS